MEEDDERIDNLIAALSDQPSLRSIVDDLSCEIRELRCQLNRIEALLQPNKVTVTPFTWTTGGTL